MTLNETLLLSCPLQIIFLENRQSSYSDWEDNFYFLQRVVSLNLISLTIKYLTGCVSTLLTHRLWQNESMRGQLCVVFVKVCQVSTHLLHLSRSHYYSPLPLYHSQRVWGILYSVHVVFSTVSHYYSPPPGSRSLSLSACVVIVRGVTQPTDSRTSYTVHQFAANSHSLTIALSLAPLSLSPSYSCHDRLRYVFIPFISIINISCIL